ncbi:MAG: ABC transporter ATP-binding protein [Acidimicrobiales bacterium]
MTASAFGGGGVLLVVVVVLLVARAGYALARSRQKRRPVGTERPKAVADLDEVRPHRAPQDGLPSADDRGRVADAILDIRDLSVTYGPKTAVDHIGLQIARGEIFGLLGPNGAGKTSTLSAIEGLVRPRSGTVLLDGVDVARHPIEAKAKMGVSLQATSFQNELSVAQIVRLYAGLYGVEMSGSEIADNLSAIGLGAEAAKPFRQLSGGQQQRLALYVAVIHQPVLLLLDEPTAGLDPQSRRQLWGRIEHIRKDGGSILLTTHSMEEAQAVCDRVAIIDHGTVLTTDTPKDLIERHKA